MAAHNPQALNQPLAYLSTNRKPPIDNFDQWAQLVKSQMLASLHRRQKHSLQEL